MTEQWSPSEISAFEQAFPFLSAEIKQLKKSGTETLPLSITDFYGGRITGERNLCQEYADSLKSKSKNL